MKIAIPTRGNEVDSHFGHCEFYTLYEVNENKEIINKQTLPSPQGCGCKSDIASVLEAEGVSVMLAGNMGNGALNVLNSHNIKVLRGCGGDIEIVMANYLDGKLSDSGTGCHSHDHEHICNH
jgi:predicted Fe-Mo cluster-binding NifX family protein